MTIWKYKTQPFGPFIVEMPKGARVLSFQAQRGEPCFWALVEPGEVEKRQFFTIGTGHVLPEIQPGLCTAYIGTCQIQDDDLVVHLFEVVDQITVMPR